VGDGQPGRDKCRMISAPSDCEAQSPAHWEGNPAILSRKEGC